ncbi:MAG: MATE family efflux transporter [Bacteroidetes bacterium]|nr:MATE family efflux transporter [Bacteroidota bacterium]
MPADAAPHVSHRMISTRHLRETTALAIPVSIGQLGHVMLSVTDSLMVGQLGAAHLAAASLGHSVFVLLLVFAIGCSSAITPLTAIAAGKGDHDEAGIVFRQGLLLCAFIGILLIGAAWILTDFLDLLGQEQHVLVLAAPYLRILGFSFLPMMIFLSTRHFIEGLSWTRPAMIIILLANAVNVGGNWVLIYGNLGMPALGLNGAGYSSLLVELFSAVAIFTYVFRAKRFRRYQPILQFRSINISVMRRLLRIGVPSGVQYMLEAGSFSFSAIMMGWIGATALAAHQIAISLASVSFMIILGISHAGTIRVANFVGKRDGEEIRRAGVTAAIMALGCMSLAALTFILFRTELPKFYIDDTSVISLAASLLIYAAVFQLSDGMQAVGHGILRGMTDVTVPMMIAAFAYWVVGLPSGYLFAFILDFGPEGIWLGFVGGLTTAAVAFHIRFHRLSRRLFPPSPAETAPAAR